MPALTTKQQAVLIGGLLGDLHIQKTPATIGARLQLELRSAGKCRLRVCHSKQQRDFVDWKYQVFKNDFCQTTKPPFVDRTDYIFYTGYRKEFTHYHSVWYPSISDDRLFGKKSVAKFVKKIPSNIGEILTDPLALAIWYLDDGTKRSDTESCRIATQSFSKQEHLLLQDCLKQNFGFNAKIEDWGKTKTGREAAGCYTAGAVVYSLAILSRSGDFKKFRDLTYDIIKAEVPSMLYKLE